MQSGGHQWSCCQACLPHPCCALHLEDEFGQNHTHVGCRIQSETGLLSSYVHTSPAPGLGRMAALVALETSASSLSSEQQADAKVSFRLIQ